MGFLYWLGSGVRVAAVPILRPPYRCFVLLVA